MKDIFKGQPLSEEAPQGLRNKVEFAAQQPQKASWFNGGFKWAATGTAVAAATIAVVMFMTPATAKSWDDVTEAYQDVKSALIRINIQEDGAPEEILIAMKGNRFRVSVSGEMDMSLNNGEMLIYEAGSDTVQLMQLDQLPIQLPTEMIIKQVVSEISMANLLKQAEGEIGKENIRISKVYVLDGRSVYDVAIQDPKDGMRAFLTVDAQSDLPRDLKIEQLVNGQYVTEAVMSFRFNEEFNDSYLEFSVPSGVKTKVIDMGDMMNGGDEGFDFDFGGFRDHDDDDEVIIDTDVKLETAVIRR